MGGVSSRPDVSAPLYLRDQNRFSIAGLTVTNSRKQTVVAILPNAYPASRVVAKKDAGDNSVIEYVQDPDSISSSSGPEFLLKLNNDDELNFTFTFILRQTQINSSSPSTGPTTAISDSALQGLTFVSASTAKEVENLVTLDFHADPNLHKLPNVHLLGDYSTGGSPSVTFDWTWKWTPPKPSPEKGGWRNSCSFLEYDQRAHRLDTLATFSFWVPQHDFYDYSNPNSPSPMFALSAPPKLRIPSSQSVDSRRSMIESRGFDDQASPMFLPANTALDVPYHALDQTAQQGHEAAKVDVACQRPTEDLSATDDGPLFRATMKALEQKTGNMRTKMKKVIKKAEAAAQAQTECNEAMAGFMDALRQAASSNANAVQPAMDHYFDKIAKEILQYEKENAGNLRTIIIDPLTKVYEQDIKRAEAKKKDFDDESREYYTYMSKYLGQRNDALKEKKKAESDDKYQKKRRTFELKRFDYSSFMQDLHGGRKEQEVLSHLTKYADAQTKSYLNTAKKVEGLLPQLEALSSEVKEADKEFDLQKTEREEKRRTLEMSTLTYNEPDLSKIAQSGSSNGYGSVSTSSASDNELKRTETAGSRLRPMSMNGFASIGGTSNTSIDSAKSPGSVSTGGTTITSPREVNKFKGFRDLEEKDYQSAGNDGNGTERKEGLLWALSRPGSHADPKGLNKQAWHKFWIVLDQGKLSEYSNWKQKLDLHMEPIDLRLASVREARSSERRFCFEVITPHYTRVYQATSEEDMNSWISAINNALQSAVEGRGIRDIVTPTAPPPSHSSSFRKDIGSILTGKSSSVNHGHHQSVSSTGVLQNKNDIFRRTTVGSRPTYPRKPSGGLEDSPDKLLQLLREADQGNCWCADCGSGVKTEWVSINLGIILCIECSGIHRSLGTHISKVRSLTLDITSFTADIVELLLAIGNRVSNMVWEAKLEPGIKPSPQATREQRLKFITAKYVDRAFVAPISATLSAYGTPDDTLLAAVKKNQIQQVLYALALRASPNVLDKSRATHPVFLALAAADPALPGTTLTPPTTSVATMAPPPPPRPGTPVQKPVAFPIAELLTQNGAEVPQTLPAFPLSRSALAWVEGKRSKRDSISPLPAGGLSAGGSINSGVAGGLGGGIAMSEKEREKQREARLQKRVSAGGRLAKAVIPER